MSLAFLVPAFLFGLGVLAIPILVHLRQREQREPVRFPSLMFLTRITHRTTERRRITNRLLLLLRALAVIALVLAFARPFMEREPERLLAGRRQGLVVVVDRSMSMAYGDVWQRAMDSIRASVGRMAPGERVGVITFDERAEVVLPLTADRAAVAAALGRIETTAAGTRLATGLRAAGDVVAAARDEALEVMLVSDLQRHALRGLETVDPLPGATLRVVPVGAANPANARVVSVTVDRAVAGRLASLRVGARVGTEGGTAPRQVRATLIVNGRELATAQEVLPPSGLSAIAFPEVKIPDAASLASVRLEPDDLAPDDEHRFVLAGPAGVRVVLVVPPGLSTDDLVYLERALAISRAPSFVVEIRRGAPTARDLERAVAIVAADLAPLANRSSQIADFLARGGGVLAFVGPRTGTSSRGGDWLPARIGQVRDRVADRGGRLGWVEADHPIFEPFREAVSSDFGAARFFRYRELTADSSAATLARFDDGRPALVERQVGNGRVLLWASSADALWSDLPLQPVFLPLVHRLVAYASRAGDDRRSWELGQVASLPASTGGLVVTRPGGEIDRVAPDSSVRSIALAEVGYYEVRDEVASEPVAVLAVNPPAVESDLTAAAPAEVAAALRSSRDSTSALAAPEPLTAVEQEARQSWWVWLLALALALLAGEAWYAARLSGAHTAKGGTS